MRARGLQGGDGVASGEAEAPSLPFIVRWVKTVTQFRPLRYPSYGMVPLRYPSYGKEMTTEDHGL